MYIAELNESEQRVFSDQGDLVAYYNKNCKGDNLVDVYECSLDALGDVVRGEYMFSFYTSDYGDLV